MGENAALFPKYIHRDTMSYLYKILFPNDKIKSYRLERPYNIFLLNKFLVIGGSQHVYYLLPRESQFIQLLCA